MDKYIGFDIDSKKTIACVVQKGQKDKFTTLKTDIEQMKKFLQNQREPGGKLHLTFEISGQAGYRYDALSDFVEDITVSNPTKMTWIYRTAKKNDRIDARKQAILLSIGEVPRVHIPRIEVRQWRVTIQHRRKIVGRITQVRNRIRAILKANGFTKAAHRGNWWKLANRRWMRTIASAELVTISELWRMSLAEMLDELDLLESQLKRITKYLDEYLSRHPGRKKIAIVAVARKLLSIMRAMQMTGELFNERLVCRECGIGELVKIKESA